MKWTGFLRRELRLRNFGDDPAFFDPATQEEVLICHLLVLIPWRRACAT
jgi:hypothetical protein